MTDEFNDEAESEMPGPVLDQKIDAMLAAKLRSFYEYLMHEPIPDRILELLNNLSEKERQSGQDHLE